MLRVKSFVDSKGISALALSSGLCVALAGSAFAQGAAEQAAPAAQEPTPMVIDGPTPATPEELLKAVKAGWAVERKEDKAREQRFAVARDEQTGLLAEAKGVEASKEGLSSSSRPTIRPRRSRSRS